MDDLHDECMREANVRFGAGHGARSNGVVVRDPCDSLHSPGSVRAGFANETMRLVSIAWTDRVVRAWWHPPSFPELVALRRDVLLSFSLGAQDDVRFERDADEVDNQVAFRGEKIRSAFKP